MLQRALHMVIQGRQRDPDVQGHICRGSVRPKMHKLFPVSLQALLCKKKIGYLILGQSFLVRLSLQHAECRFCNSIECYGSQRHLVQVHMCIWPYLHFNGVF